MADQEEQKPDSPKAPSPKEEPQDEVDAPPETGDAPQSPKPDDAGRQTKSPVQADQSGEGDLNQSAGGDETQEQTETEQEPTETGLFEIEKQI